VLLTFADTRGDGLAPEGRVIAGRYRIVRTLANGGMGPVWVATDETNGKPVAIKKCVVPEGLSAYEQRLVRSWAYREARAFARVNHPNVVRIVDVVPAIDDAWIVMEYVPSRSLQQIIDESGPLPPARVAAIGLAVLHGLKAVHRAGVLHLDVKPGNVLIGDDGRIVLTDCAPAVSEEGVAAFARAGIILGSPKYIAPERLFDGVTTAPSDLWSLGAMMYHAVEGRPPYLRETTGETLLALGESPPDRLHRAGPLLPVLEGLLQRDPAARMTAAELEDRLRRLAGRAPRALTRRIRHIAPRRVAALTGAAALVAVLAAVAAGTRQAEQPVTAPKAPTVVQPAVPSSSPAVIPRDFGWWNDPSGFRVAVPTGWRRGRDPQGVVSFTGPAGQPSLRIRSWVPRPANVVAAFIAQEEGARLAGYRRVRMQALNPPPDAVWEYTYEDPSTGPMRGLQQVVEAAGRTYVLEWRTPRAAWAADLQKLAVILASFGPPAGA
jgi:eukaryotic-like serine/threonine-protein kinase